MDKVLGASNSDHAFARYLARWPSTMANRIAQSASAIGEIDGVEGLILAGSNGIGKPWPLSDIDLIPIYADDKQTSAIAQVAETRLALVKAWSHQGWCTGIDVGRLRFTVHELDSIFAADDPDPVALLADERWYHSIDKAYGGRALIDCNGGATQLLNWFTTHRFDRDVVRFRSQRAAKEARSSFDLVRDCLANSDRAGAFAALLQGILWYQTGMMEAWGERDNSLSRFGTRFERTACSRGRMGLIHIVNELGSLGAVSLEEHLRQAPRWVAERKDRSWKARRLIGEPVSALQNDRDTFRLCRMYALRLVDAPPYPAWLGIPLENEMGGRAQALMTLVAHTPLIR